MTGRETGFLLLTSQLGNPDRKVLTPAQLRVLAQRSRDLDVSDPNRDLTWRDLIALGYSPEMARRIVGLLEERELLEYYCLQAKKAGCVALTRVTAKYPGTVRSKLGLDSPGCLWAKGDLSLLQLPAVSLVGSRDLQPQNREFARMVGREAARQGYVLISGNARGADKEAQEACLQAGGQVIAVVADSLQSHKPRENMLYLSEDGFDHPFSAQRAISRNRCVHTMGRHTFVAQSGYQTGGTWDGTVKNLRHGWSPVHCYDDGTPAMELLIQMGAQRIREDQLADFDRLPKPAPGLFFGEETL